MTMFIAAITVLLIMLSMVSIAINTLCVFVIARSKSLRKRPSTMLLVNLLAVHLIQGAVVFPFYTAKKNNPSSRIACDGFRFTYMLTFYAAVLSVLLIAIDRALATFFVLRYKELVAKQRVIVAIALMWIYVTVLCTIPFEGETEKLVIQKNASAFNNASAIVRTPTCTYKQSATWSTLMLLLNCVLPYLAIVIGYQVILKRIQNIELKSRSSTLTVADGIVVYTSEVTKNKTITKLAIILSVVYLVLWSPSVIYYNLLHFCPDSCFVSGYHDSDAEPRVSFAVKYLAYLDALAAPLCYCFFHREFREELYDQIWCCDSMKIFLKQSSVEASKEDVSNNDQYNVRFAYRNQYES